jgi:hypothetical protein
LLFDLNQQFLRLLLKCFRITLPLHLTTEYHTQYPAQLSAGNSGLLSTQPIADRRDWLTPKATTKTPEPDTPAASALVRPYPQVFGPGFEPGLSVLDLLFSQGPAAGRYLQ